MQLERRIFVNTAVLGVGEAAGQLANFVFVVLLARRYGAEVFGWYSFAMALGAVLAPFVSLGGSTYITREVARDDKRASSLLSALRPIQLASGAVVWLVMALVALKVGVDRDNALIIVIVGAYHVLLRMGALYLTPDVARERLASTAVLGAGHRVLLAALAGMAILLGFGAQVALLAMPVSAFALLLVARAVGKRDVPASPACNGTIQRAALVRASLPFLGTALLAALYDRGGVLLLTAMRGELSTAMFAAADRLLVPMYMVTGVFATAVFPPLMRLSNKPQDMRMLGRRCLRLVLLVMIPLAAGLAVFAADLTTVIFGPQLQAAAPVLALLAPLPALRSINALWMNQCVALNQEERAVLIKTRAVATFFVFAAIGIAALGASGLAISSVASEVLLALGLRRVLANHAQYHPAWKIARAPMMATVCASVAALLMSELALPARLLVFAATIIGVTALLDGVGVHDFRFFAAILRSRDNVGSAHGSRADSCARR
jgi:O-antigen/teichoic acid export membrane protein